MLFPKELKLKLRIEVTKWHAQIEPVQANEAYIGYDGRTLYVEGYASGNEMKGAHCQILFEPIIAQTALEAGACGIAEWWSDNDLPHFHMKVGLPRILWSELWARSAAPPKQTTVWMEIEREKDHLGFVRAPLIQMST